MPPEPAPLVAVENLTKHFPIMRGVFRRRVGSVRAVDGLDFAIYPRETLGLVGESGCGKSTVGRVILRLYPPTAGRVTFRGEDITVLQGEALRKLRPHMQMIFQDPQDSLNPRMTVGSIVGDPAVRRALSLAIDRQILVDFGYGAAGQVTCNVLPAPPVYASAANDGCVTQDIEEANRILDEAGWLPGDDGVRQKDGVRLSILYQTSTNSVRQGTQALIKQMWGQIGVETELRNIDAAVFFGGDPASPDTYMKFYADIQMYTNNFDGVDPEAYMANWTCSEIPEPENQWLGGNIARACNAEYDALAAEMAVTASLEERAVIAKRMNDIVVQNQYVIPLIWRAKISAHANTLKGVRMNPWDSELWNTADWHR